MAEHDLPPLPVVAWTDCWGDPFRHREEAMHHEDSEPEPLVRQSDAQAAVAAASAGSAELRARLERAEQDARRLREALELIVQWDDAGMQWDDAGMALLDHHIERAKAALASQPSASEDR